MALPPKRGNERTGARTRYVQKSGCPTNKQSSARTEQIRHMTKTEDHVPTGQYCGQTAVMMAEAIKTPVNGISSSGEKSEGKRRPAHSVRARKEASPKTDPPTICLVFLIFLGSPTAELTCAGSRQDARASVRSIAMRVLSALLREFGDVSSSDRINKMNRMNLGLSQSCQSCSSCRVILRTRPHVTAVGNCCTKALPTRRIPIARPETRV